MNFEDLHSDLEQFPEELNYSEEMWDGALSAIEAHEAAVQKRRLYVGVSSAAVFLLLIFVLPVGLDSISSEYKPREQELLDYSWEENLESQSSLKFENISEINRISNKNDNVEESAESLLNFNSEPITPIIEKKDQSYSEKELARVDKGTNSRSLVDSKRNYLTNDKIEEGAQPVKASKVEVEKNLTENGLFVTKERTDVSPEVSLEISESSNLRMRSALLQRRYKRNSSLKSKEVRTGKALFTVYKEFLGLKLGVNPWNDYGTISSVGNYNPSVGLFYENIIIPNVSWSAGIEYFSLSSFDLAISSSETSYNYSAESKVTTVHTNKAHFFAAPVNASVRPFPRLQVKGGLAPGVLLETENTKEEYFNTHSSEELLNSDEARGYRTSFRTFQLAGTISANYWFSKRNSLQLTLHKGFTDFSKNEVYNNTNEDTTSRIEISLNRIIR